MQVDEARKILGLSSSSASKADINKAFRKLARIHYPDKNPPAEKEKCTARFYEISKAKETLLEEDKPEQNPDLDFASNPNSDPYSEHGKVIDILSLISRLYFKDDLS